MLSFRTPAPHTLPECYSLLRMKDKPAITFGLISYCQSWLPLANQPWPPCLNPNNFISLLSLATGSAFALLISVCLFLWPCEDFLLSRIVWLSMTQPVEQILLYCNTGMCVHAVWVFTCWMYTLNFLCPLSCNWVLNTPVSSYHL